MVHNKKLLSLMFLQSMFLQFFFSSVFGQDVNAIKNTVQHPFYLGAMGGHGSTTWTGLVPSQKNQNLALNMSTPIDVKEGGNVWGVVVGYEFIPYFALEASYMRYPDARVTFDSMSLFSFTNDGLAQFLTHTESLNVMGKIMLFVPSTKLRVYSSAGVANTHRNDMLLNQWRVSPTFGVGVNYHITDHFMGEIGANYTAGFGESQLNPTESYFPFLYSISLRLAYCF
jgi:hypothetical protein